MDQQEELGQLFPAPVKVAIAGRDIEVAPLTLGELPALLALLHNAGSTVNVSGFDPLVLLVEQPDLAVNLIAVLTRQEAAWLKALALDDAAALLVAAIEANQSFFVRHGRALVAAVERAMGAVGRLPSPA